MYTLKLTFDQLKMLEFVVNIAIDGPTTTVEEAILNELQSKIIKLLEPTQE